MFMLLSLAKQGVYHHQETRAGGFARLRGTGRGVEIADKELLIIGFGRIGKQVAPRARAFGMEVSVYDPYVDHEIIQRAQVSMSSSANLRRQRATTRYFPSTM